MVSGYVLRNGQYGSQNLTSVGRADLPQWAVRLYGVASNVMAGPAVSSSYPPGRYMEEMIFWATSAFKRARILMTSMNIMAAGVSRRNSPTGTYAYFVCINSNGMPVFP